MPGLIPLATSPHSLSLKRPACSQSSWQQGPTSWARPAVLRDFGQSNSPDRTDSVKSRTGQKPLLPRRTGDKEGRRLAKPTRSQARRQPARKDTPPTLLPEDVPAESGSNRTPYNQQPTRATKRQAKPPKAATWAIQEKQDGWRSGLRRLVTEILRRGSGGSSGHGRTIEASNRCLPWRPQRSTGTGNPTCKPRRMGESRTPRSCFPDCRFRTRDSRFGHVTRENVSPLTRRSRYDVE